jgi:hypothetical protein
LAGNKSKTREICNESPPQRIEKSQNLLWLAPLANKNNNLDGERRTQSVFAQSPRVGAEK